MKNIKLDIQYDGTDFNGSQIQDSGRTVQGELEKSLSNLTKEKIKALFSGRTDSGVHAKHQVVNFKTESTIPPEKFYLALKSFLPNDILVLSSEEVSIDFNSRFDARNREYRYFISNRRDLFNRKYTLFVKDFDIDKANELNELFIKNKNYRSFCSYKSSEKTFLCDIRDIGWKKSNDNIYFEVKANRYLHNMIRILVSTYLEYVTDRLSYDDVKRIINAKDRKFAPQTISPIGLFLWKIEY